MKQKFSFILSLYIFCSIPITVYPQANLLSHKNNDAILRTKPYGLDFSIAGNFLEHKQYKAAAKEYQKLINSIQKINAIQFDKVEINQILARAHMGFGFALDYLNKDKQALMALQKAIELDSTLKKNLMLQTTIGSIYGDLGLKGREIKHYKKIIKFNSKFYQAYFNLALALGDIGRFNEALDFLKKAIELKPNYAKAYLQLAKGSEAIGEFKKAIDYYLMAQRLYLKLGRKDIEREISLRLNQLLKRFGKST